MRKKVEDYNFFDAFGTFCFLYHHGFWESFVEALGYVRNKAVLFLMLLIVVAVFAYLFK